MKVMAGLCRQGLLTRFLTVSGKKRSFKNCMLKRIDWTLLVAFLGLIVIGSLVLFSATHGMRFSNEIKNHFNRQMVWICFGFLSMITIGCVNYKSVGNATFLIYAVNLVLLVYVLIAGARISGARRWINFGGFSL